MSQSELQALHKDEAMIPPPGYKFIPKDTQVCGLGGCFLCFDIFCDRCESKDRRILELELRNSDLVKYITQLQGKLLGTRTGAGAAGGQMPGATGGITTAGSPTGANGEPFAYIQSPVLYDPNIGVSYVSTTTFNAVGGSNPAK